MTRRGRAKPDLFFPAGFAKGPINCRPISVTHIKQLTDTNPHTFHELSMLYHKNIIPNFMHTKERDKHAETAMC